MTYNPQNLHECEKEKEKTDRRRTMIDGAMTIVGLVASVSSVPQVLKIIETGNVAGISLLTQIIGLVAVVAWFSYGFYIKNKPLMITTSVTTVVLSVVIVQILVLR